MRRDDEAAAQRWAAIVTGAAVLGFLLVGALAQNAAPEEDFSAWPEHRRQFGSTGGGGVVIGAYDPVVRGALCTTDFTATLADGTVLRNAAEFDAVAVQGGILCTNGRWRSLENDARGTTPYRVFFRDGVVRGWPQ